MASLFSQLISRLRQALQSTEKKQSTYAPYVLSSDSSVESISKEIHRHQWDEEIGALLSRMLQLAGYSQTSEAVHRHFFAGKVSRSLGPHAKAQDAKPAWQSFMTDDHTPVELSWSWSEKSALPAVRYAVEPIDWLAGSEVDLLNSKAGVACLGDSFPWAPSLDLQWYRHFAQALGITADELSAYEASKTETTQNPPSQTFIAFDLEQTSVVVKYYFLPHMKAMLSNTTNLDLIKESIFSLPELDDDMRAALDTFLEYVCSFPDASQPKVEIFAIDCISPTESRLKVYFRSNETTFASMLDAMSLGGRLPRFSECMEDCIKDLWCKSFGIENAPQILSEPLEANGHRTGGLLYYVEFKMGSQVPSTKVYLPVRHYAQDDEQIARGVSSFLEANKKTLKGGMTYYDAVSQLCTHRQLKYGLGFHTYITCSVKRGEISVNAYFNPETYSTKGPSVAQITV